VAWFAEEYVEAAGKSGTEAKAQHWQQPASAFGFGINHRLSGLFGRSLFTICGRSVRSGFCGLGCGEIAFQRSWCLTKVGLKILIQSIKASKGDVVEISHGLNKAGDFRHGRFPLLVGICSRHTCKSSAAVAEFESRIDEAISNFALWIFR